MKKHILIIFLISFFSAKGQDSTNFKAETVEKIQAEFPRSRIINLEYGRSFNRDYESELFESAFENGDIEGQQAVSLTVNLPFLAKERFVLSANAGYSRNQFSYSNPNIDREVAFNNFSFGISGMYFSTLFKKKVVYNSSILMDGGDEGVERIKGLIGATIILKSTNKTTISSGLIFFVDPTSQIPFFPTFAINHKLANSAWEVDFILPQRILLRRPMGLNGRFSIGPTLGGSGFYVNADMLNNSQVFEYSQIEINYGAMYEHKVNHQFITTISAGLRQFASSRLTEKGEPTQDFIYSNQQSSSAYINLSLSYNPFGKKNESQ